MSRGAAAAAAIEPLKTMQTRSKQVPTGLSAVRCDVGNQLLGFILQLSSLQAIRQKNQKSTQVTTNKHARNRKLCTAASAPAPASSHRSAAPPAHNPGPSEPRRPAHNPRPPEPRRQPAPLRIMGPKSDVSSQLLSRPTHVHAHARAQRRQRVRAHDPPPPRAAADPAGSG